MENFFVCRKDVQDIDMELVHSLEELNSLTADLQTSQISVVQQRLDETWDGFISRAQKICQTIIPPRIIESWLDRRRFCSLEFNLEGPFHFKAIPCSKGEIRFPWTNNLGKTEYYQTNVFKVQTLTYPQIELYVPIGSDEWRGLHGTWQLRIDSRNRLYWNCEAGRLSSAPQSQVTVVERPGEQFPNQNTPQPIGDALDKPFEFSQSRRLVHSGQ